MSRPTEELYATDAYLHTFEARVAAADPDAHRVALDRTAFYPGGGGQPADRGTVTWHDGSTSSSMRCHLSWPACRLAVHDATT